LDPTLSPKSGDKDGAPRIWHLDLDPLSPKGGDKDGVPPCFFFQAGLTLGLKVL
jgi:hypothetical protein